MAVAIIVSVFRGKGRGVISLDAAASAAQKADPIRDTVID